MRYIISNGDILILDEVDAMLKEQDLIDFCSVLSQLRDYQAFHNLLSKIPITIFLGGINSDFSTILS